MVLLHFEVVSTEAERPVVGVDLVGGAQFMAGIMGWLRGDAPLISLRVWHVGFGEENGATFVVIERAGAGKPDITWVMDPGCQYELGDPLLLATDMLVYQAHDELSVSLGLEPGFGQFSRPRSIWTSEFRWDPPLEIDHTPVERTESGRNDQSGSTPDEGAHRARPAGDKPGECRYCGASIELVPGATGEYVHQERDGPPPSLALWKREPAGDGMRRASGKFMVFIATLVMIAWYVAGIIGCFNNLDGTARLLGFIPGAAIGLTWWDRDPGGNLNWIWAGTFLVAVIWIWIAEAIAGEVLVPVRGQRLGDPVGRRRRRPN